MFAYKFGADIGLVKKSKLYTSRFVRSSSPGTAFVKNDFVFAHLVFIRKHTIMYILTD